MAHPALLQNNIFRWLPLICLLAKACNYQTPKAALPSLNIAASDIEFRNGIGYYNKQPFSGCLFVLQENGKDTIFTGSYLDGIPDGIHTHRYPNGKILEVRMYTRGLKTGVHKEFSKRGTLRFRYNFRNDLYEGVQYKWFENGQLYTRKYFKNGFENGMQQEWDRHGKLIINYQSVNGRQYGNIGKKHCVSLWSDSIYSKPHR